MRGQWWGREKEGVLEGSLSFDLFKISKDCGNQPFANWVFLAFIHSCEQHCFSSHPPSPISRHASVSKSTHVSPSVGP